MNDQFMNLGGRLLTNKLTLKGFQLSGLKFLHTDCDCRLLRLPGREREREITADVTGQKGIRTSRNLIPPLVFIDVLVCTTFDFVFFIGLITV